MRGGDVYTSTANINGNWHTVVLVVCKTIQQLKWCKQLASDTTYI